MSFFEEQTEPYLKYGEGVPEKKIEYGAKKSKVQTAPAGWQFDRCVCLAAFFGGR